MAIGGIVASNYAIEQVISWWLSELAAGSTLHLFQNAISVTPDTLIGDFVESDFVGYSEVDISAFYGGPAQITSGEYQSAVSAVSFFCTGGSPQPVYGYYLVQTSSDTVWFSENFSTPLYVIPGSTFQLQLNLQEWALAIVSP